MGKRISFRFFFVRYLRKTPGIHKMVRIATDQSKTFSPRVIKIACQVSRRLYFIGRLSYVNVCL